MFNLEYSSLLISLYIGTILALILVFHKEWGKLIKSGINQLKKKEKNDESIIFWRLVIGIIPTIILYLIFRKLFAQFISIPVITAILTILFALVSIYTEKYKEEPDKKYNNLSMKQMLILQIAQSLSFIPGLSSVIISITLGNVYKIKKNEIFKYSFIYFLPILITEIIIQSIKIQNNIGIGQFIIGALITCILAIMAIKFIQSYSKRKSLKIFSYYRIFVGIVFLIVCFFRSEILWKIINSLDSEIYKNLMKIMYFKI